MKSDKITNYNLIREIAVLGVRENETKEANLISWNGKPPVIDIRYWNAEHTVMSNGITFTQSELSALIKGVKAWTEENKK